MPILCLDFLCIVQNKSEFKILLAKRNNNPAKGFYYVPGGRHIKNKNIFLDVKSKAKKELDIDINHKKLFFTGLINERFEDSIFPNIPTTTVTLSFTYLLDENDLKKIEIKLDSQNSHYKFWFLIFRVTKTNNRAKTRIC